MAKKLSGYDWHDSRKIYPWDEWLDGNVWELRQGEDFDCKPVSMKTTAQAAGRTRGLSVHVSCGERTVLIQAIEKRKKK